MVPQIIYIVIMSLSLGMDLMKHGEPREGNHNFWISFLSATIMILILYWGGFFNVFFK